MTDREDLEKLALAKVSAENHYELADNIDSTSDEELKKIIASDGNYEKEMEIHNGGKV